VAVSTISLQLPCNVLPPDSPPLRRGWLSRLFLQRLVLRFVFHSVLTVKTPMGRKGPAEHPSVKEQPGLYFVGLHFLYSMSSTMIHGVGRDAARIADAAAARAQSARTAQDQTAAAVPRPEQRAAS
jgi:hypothetical protein